MTSRRLPNSRATVALTGGAGRPEPACLGRPWAFDMLTDYGANRTTQHALREAAALCASCPLRDAGCWAENWDEPWMLAMRGQPIPRHHKPKVGAA